MHVTVRLFASLRDRAGASELTLELPDGARVDDALTAVQELTAGITVVMAVNREYADGAQPLSPGDELALIPPVSGGSDAAQPAGPDSPHDPDSPDSPVSSEPYVRITDEPLALDPLVARVRDPRAGAVVTFTGVTREVDHLDYEAYAEMAQGTITQIVTAAIARHGLCRAAVEHRVGRVALGEASVAIAVSAPHRGEAFAGGRQIIDEIKARAPIWKREEGEWVAGTSPAA